MITVSDLTAGQKEILEQWKTIAHENQSGSTFSIEEEAKHNEIEERLPQFLDDPSEETFETLWNTIYSAQRAGSAGYLLNNKWRDGGRTVEELADFISEVANTEEYDETWEDTLGSIRPLREFFGWLHVDTQPIIDMQTIRGLEFFDVVDSGDSLKRRSFEEQRERFADFKNVYRAVIGHATEDTDHELPINLEIYLLLLLTKRAGKSKLREETNDEIETFYELVLEERERRNGGDATNEEATTEDDDLGHASVWYMNPAHEWQTCKSEGLTTIGWPEVMEMELDKVDEADIRDQFDDTGFTKSTSLYNFGNKLAKGSILVAKTKTDQVYGLGVITSDYYRDRSIQQELFEDDSNCHFRDVEWIIDFVEILGEPYTIRWDEFDRGQFQASTGVRGFTDAYPTFRQQVLERIDGDGDLNLRSKFEELERLSNTLTHSPDDDPDYYWVNQNDPAEIEGEYLDATVDDHWSHDLSVLEVGDIVFHYTGQQVIGYSTVTEEPYTIEQDGTDRYRVEVDLERFDEPRPLDDIRDHLLRDEVRGEKYYPIAEDGRVTQAYLCQLTEEAADYLLELPTETSYFWILANPTDQRTESLVAGFDEGDQLFYPAYNQQGNKRRVFTAFEEAEPGDKVLFYASRPVHGIVAEGKIVDSLHPEEHDDHDNPVDGVTIEFRRSIEKIPWEKLTSVPDLEEASPILNNSAGNLFRLSAGEYETILALEEPGSEVSDEEFETLREKLDPITVDFELPDTLYFEDASNLRSEIEASLNSGKHIIFTGPPGTGKTKLAKEICRQSARDLPQVDDHTFTTATSEWTAFDTIGGYVPSTNTEESRDELTFQPRLFLNCFRREQEGIVNNWLVIDEINRSDIDKAFGQLFSVLSGDSVELPYERQNQVEIVSVARDASDDNLREISSNPDVFPVTPSWRLLATMNTYDKASLYEMSYAFMRRFNFVHVGIPDLETDDGRIRASLLDPDGDDNYATAWLAEDSGLEPALEEIYREVAVIWKVVNDYPRSIGPSIVRDTLGYVDAYGVGDDPSRKDEALSAAIVGMVYPQLEGLRPDKQRNLVRDLAGEWETDRGDVSLDLDEGRLKAKAADYFDISFDDE